MMYLNRATLIGNVTRDPEVRTTPAGQTVATFSLATNYSWTDQSGQRQEKAEFHNIVAWRKLGEIASQYIRKGKPVYIEGRIQTREWTAQDGQRRFRTEIVAENLILLGSPSGSGAAAGGMNARPSAPARPRPATPAADEMPTIDQEMPTNYGSAGGPDNEEEIKVENIPF